MKTKLYKIPQKSHIIVDTKKGEQTVMFHHTDGMYSYCTVLEGMPDAGAVVYLSVNTPLEPIPNMSHTYRIAPPSPEDIMKGVVEEGL